MDIVKLTSEERQQLEWIMEHGDKSLRSRAQLMLLQEQDKTSVEVGEKVGLSAGRVRHWLRAFREQRMGIFPEDILAQSRVEVETKPEAQEAETATKLPTEHHATQDPRPVAGVIEICHQENVDFAHVRFVADIAMEFFRLTQPVHALDEGKRMLLQAAALLSDVDPSLIMAHNLEEHTDSEQHVLECILAFMQGKFKAKRLSEESAYLALPQDAQKIALALAALLRIVKALDASNSQSSHPVQVKMLSDSLEVLIEGPYAKEDGLKAQTAADLWAEVFEPALRMVVESEPGLWVEPIAARDSGGLKPQKRKKPGIVPDDLMSEAGRKLIRLHAERMLYYESGTRSGEEIEDLHKMRVATRRMRSGFQIFASCYDAQAIKPILKGLRRTARRLGRVRDLDVFMQKAHHYLGSRSPEDAPNLEPLLDVWKARREVAREEMLAYLDGDRYKRFLGRIGTFATTEGAAVPPAEDPDVFPDRVYQVVPTFIYARYEAVRRYEPVILDAPLETLHALRIDCKRFRYTLEFFQEVLGDSVNGVIEEVIRVQDHLGDLNDADIACQILIDYLGDWSRQERREKVDISGVTRYLVAKQEELRHLLATFPQSWQHFTRGEVRRDLALSVSEL